MNRELIAKELIRIGRELKSSEFNEGDKVTDKAVGGNRWISESKSLGGKKLYFLSVNRNNDDTGYWQEARNLKLTKKSDATW
jgi:hypothetical protein